MGSKSGPCGAAVFPPMKLVDKVSHVRQRCLIDRPTFNKENCIKNDIDRSVKAVHFIIPIDFTTSQYFFILQSLDFFFKNDLISSFKDV